MSWVAIAELLTSPAERPVAVDPGKTLGDLRRDTAALVAELRGKSATSVLLVAEDTYRFAAGFLAALHAGLPLTLAPATLLGPRRPGEILLAESQHSPDLHLDHDFAGTAALAPLDPERASIAFLTSGSTGEPKRVPKRLVHLEREIATLEATFGAEAGSGPVRSTVANHHIYGILFYVLWPLARGIPFACRQAAHWGPLLGTLKDGILVSSPAHLGRLEGIEALPADARPRLVFSSGGLLAPEAAAEGARVLGQAPVEVFGSTETGGVAWRRQETPGVPWRLFPGVTATPSDDSLLQVRSGLFDDPLVEMGDRVALGGEGTFTLLGRADRIVKVEGTRVSLTEIEAALLTLPGITEARALLLPGRREAIGAVLVASAESRLALLRRIRGSLSGKLPRVALPRRLRLVEAMPVNSQGKTTQADLLALFEIRAANPMGDPDILAVRAALERCEIDLMVPAGLPCFDGHFPGRAVLPGVTQVDWAWRLGTRYLGLEGGFAGLKGLKFRRIVEPGTRLLLVLERRGADRFGFDFRNAEDSVSTGEIQLAPA